ncbi:hypothetical protein BUALT_Bualt01G0156700 [Buddleja alternifolia]|uniref:Annexin n=1 Tax=Buddleja alternifolia TaxID=168488 RepID=A0AAV6Y9S4_9LAMI|nr:hypothetical protein BUALT_Bualt01G0156700 [Buddleja alternifolia]
MAAADELGSLTKAFSGLGVDEKALISILGKWHPEQRQSFRKGTRDFFIQDERQFERWNNAHEATVLWTMHPWERDARLLNESLYKRPQYNVLIEVATTRSSEELLGARRAYHSLFDHSIEEDIAFHVHTPDKKLLVALLSSYRYEGPKVNEDIAKLEANTISTAIVKGGALIENEEIVRILSTRSKLHLKTVHKHYKEITGNYLDEDLDRAPPLQETVQCLITPQAYFSKVIDASLRLNADEITKDALTRVIPTRADVDMKLIKEEYHKKYGVELPKKIQDVANGSYRDFLLTLIARGD